MGMPDPILIMPLMAVPTVQVVARCYRVRDEGFCWSDNKYGDSKINQYKEYWSIHTTTNLPMFSPGTDFYKFTGSEAVAPNLSWGGEPSCTMPKTSTIISIIY